MHHIAAQTHMNRMGEKRRDQEWLDTQRISPEARYILLIDLKFAITSDADRTNTRLRMLTPDELAEVPVDLAEAYFLGVGDHGAAIFALVAFAGRRYAASRRG